MNLFRMPDFDPDFALEHVCPYLDRLDEIFSAIRQFAWPIHVPFMTEQRIEQASPQHGVPESHALLLIANNFARIQFLLFSNSAKCVALARGLVASFNAPNYLVWTLLGRAAIEHCAVLYFFRSKLDALNPCRTEFALAELIAMEDLLMQYSHGTRFNWAAAFSARPPPTARPFADIQRAVNVLTALDRLSKTGGAFSDIKAAYDKFSDFCHPTMGSHLLITDVPTQSDCRDRICIAPSPAPVRGEFVMSVSLRPVVCCFERLMLDLSALGKIRQYWTDTVLSGNVTIRGTSPQADLPDMGPDVE